MKKAKPNPERELQKLQTWVIKFVKQNQINRSKKMKLINAVKSIVTWLKGKKTYFVVAIIFVLGGLQAVGVVVPEFVWIVLSALGLGSLRLAVNKK